MPRSGLRAPEVGRLRTRLPEWIIIKSKPPTKGNLEAILREKREFIREVTADFLATFPDRDPSVNDPSPVTFTQEQLENLPERIRQWFRNNSRLPTDPEVKAKHRSKGRTHARNLAAKRYGQQIKEIARELREADSQLKGMTAFNRATSKFISDLKETDPDAYDQLYADAKEIREHAVLDYAELSPEVIADLLKRFPQKLLSDLEQYGKELPVHIWCLCAFAQPPEQTLELYTLCTPSLDAMSDSRFDTISRKEFLDWISTNLGKSAALQPESASPMVYPSRRKGLRPHVPPVKDLNQVSAHQLRAWLRTYFNYLYLWQGGVGSVPWKLIASNSTFQYIPSKCLPPGVKGLKSPNDMAKAELERWYQWLLDGQEGRLRAEQVIRFAEVSPGRNKQPIQYSGPISSRPEACNLVWTAEEKLYATKLQRIADKGSVKSSWNDLPPARTHMVYDPFSANVQEAMKFGCLEEFRTKVMIELLVQMEKYGPIHTRDTTCTEAYSAYIDPAMSEAQILRILLGPPLRSAALQENEADHSDYALATFTHWVKTNERFRHRKSDTWRGGPYGVRWIVAVFVHFAAAFTVYQQNPKRLSADRLEAFDDCHFERLKQSLSHLGDWLVHSLQETCNVLKKLFPDRGQSWRDLVVDAYLSSTDDDIGSESIMLNTHGLPRSKLSLQFCYNQLQTEDPDITLGEDDAMDVQIDKQVRKRTATAREMEELEFSDRDSLSGEEIVFSSESDTTEEYQSDENSDGSSDLSDIELGTYNSRVLTRTATENRKTNPLRTPSPKEVPVSGEGVSVNDESTAPEFSFTQDPSWMENDVAGDADAEDEELPSRILSHMSPQKPAIPQTPKKGKSGMVMEVVIQTPCRSKPAEKPSGASKHMNTETPKGGDKFSGESPGNLPIAKRRPRRSIVRSEQAEEAVRQARKGAYKRM